MKERISQRTSEKKENQSKIICYHGRPLMLRSTVDKHKLRARDFHTSLELVVRLKIIPCHSTLDTLTISYKYCIHPEYLSRHVANHLPYLDHTHGIRAMWIICFLGAIKFFTNFQFPNGLVFMVTMNAAIKDNSLHITHQ